MYSIRFGDVEIRRAAIAADLSLTSDSYWWAGNMVEINSQGTTGVTHAFTFDGGSANPWEGLDAHGNLTAFNQPDGVTSALGVPSLSGNWLGGGAGSTGAHSRTLAPRYPTREAAGF